MKLDGVPKGSRDKTRIQYNPGQIKKQLVRNEIKYSGIWSHHFMANRWGNSGNSGTLHFWGFQNHCRW